MANPFANPFGLSPDAMQRMEGGMPTYSAAERPVDISGLNLSLLKEPEKPQYSLGADVDLKKSLAANPEVSTESTGGGDVAKAGITGATTLIAKLLEAKALREKALRERKAEAAKTTAKATQQALQEQQSGTINPLTGLIGAYRSTI